MSPQNLTNVYNQNPTLQSSYTLQQYLDLFGGSSTPATTTIEPVPTPTPTPVQPGQGIINAGINQYQNQGGDGNQGGGGAFGNLDINDVKTFEKDVYNAKTGVFDQQTVTGYKDPAQGNYKTFKGKNINHGGIAFKGIAGTVMDMMGMGPKLDKNGYYDGQISGTFTGFKPSDFKNIKSFYKAKKDRQTFMDNNKIEIDRIQKEKIAKEAKELFEQRAAEATEAAARGNYTPGGSHLSRGTSGGGLGLTENQAQSVSQANKDAGYSSFSGLAKGGRVGYNDGGSTNGSGEAALSAKVKELMDDGYEFGEAVKEAMKQGYMNGGRIKSYFKGGLVSLRGK